MAIGNTKKFSIIARQLSGIMEFTIDALKRLEFDSVLCDIVNEINASDQLAKYDYKDQVLKVTVNDNLVRKMNPDQLSLLLKVK